MYIASTISAFSGPDLEAFGDCLFSKEFLSFVEEEHRNRAHTFYFYDRDERGLTAFAPGYVYDSPIPFTFKIEEFLPRSTAIESLRPSRQYLVVNAPIRLRSRVLALDDKSQELLVEEIVEWARVNGLAAVVFPFVLGSDGALRHALKTAGFASAFYEGDFYLPIQGADLEEFVQGLHPGPRKQFRNDMNRFRKSGTEIEVLDDVSANADSLAMQHRALMVRYHRPDIELTEESFRRFDRLISNRHVVVAREEGNVMGFAMSIFGHGVFQLLRYGRDPSADESARVYSNLVYIESVQRAIQLGCQRVHFGKASHRAKTLRGCLYEEGIVYALVMDSGDNVLLGDTFTELDQRNRQRFERLSRGLE